ncbi:Kinetochore protein mis15 [Escovopsis weberi]|uniref:Kinetochore protein mis15 n=1 Tax=Escovopsis weberi TaxID=150374 RepID=A0A0M8MVU3_ESCWE|nr:Kinetochore protein mis15 [Escovopsis weberi]
MARLSVPTTARLPSTLRVDPSNPLLFKSLNRLSREALVSLAISWLDEDNVANAVPYLRQTGPVGNEGEEEEEDDDDDEDSDDLFPPCRSIRELQRSYVDLQQRKGSKRDVISRILEGDWRHGLTLYQVAMVDFTYFDEHPTSQKWTAYRILPLELPVANEEEEAEEPVLAVDQKALKIPRFHPSTFLQNLQRQTLPDVKAHYQFYRPRDLPILLLRIFVVESPYNTSISLSDVDRKGIDSKLSASRVLYLAFPDGAPSIYITRFQTTGPVVLGESKNLQALIIKGVPNALSRPRERYTLKNTNLSSKNLGALLDKRGAGRGNAAGGGWSIYADEKIKQSPLDTVVSRSSLSRRWAASSAEPKRTIPMNDDQRAAKRARIVGKARFGNSGIVTDGKGVERVEVLLEDPFPGPNPPQEHSSSDDDPRQSQRKSARNTIDAVIRQAADADDGADEASHPSDSSEWRPTVRIKFQGTHVFAGIRQLLEAGIIHGERMPGWMTGEDGVTMGIIRHGRIRGNQAT